jgi:hypothetical protein
MEAIVRRMVVDGVRDVVKAKAKGGLDVRRLINMVWLEGRPQVPRRDLSYTNTCKLLYGCK